MVAVAVAVVVGVMVAATVIERVVYYIATGAGRIRPALVLGRCVDARWERARPQLA